LNPHFYGPFEIEERVGQVAYRLRLPDGSAIHPVLHVSQLKKYISRGTNISPTLPIASPNGQLKIYPVQILDRHFIKCYNEVILQLLICWSNLPMEDSSWEDYALLARHYPNFILEDKNAFEGRGMSRMEENSGLNQTEETIQRDEEEQTN
jgi:hypothetical protein